MLKEFDVITNRTVKIVCISVLNYPNFTRSDFVCSKSSLLLIFLIFWTWRDVVFHGCFRRFRHYTCTFPAASCTGLLLHYSRCYVSVPESGEVIWLLQTLSSSPSSDTWKQSHYINYGQYLCDCIVFEKCHGTGEFITRQPWLGSVPHTNPTVIFSGSSVGLQSNCCMINDHHARCGLSYAPHNLRAWVRVGSFIRKQDSIKLYNSCVFW